MLMPTVVGSVRGDLVLSFLVVVLSSTSTLSFNRQLDDGQRRWAFATNALRVESSHKRGSNPCCRRKQVSLKHEGDKPLPCIANNKAPHRQQEDETSQKAAKNHKNSQKSKNTTTAKKK
jgi:hypothetical protein